MTNANLIIRLVDLTEDGPLDTAKVIENVVEEI